METRANYVLIGLFSILSVIAAATFILWIANSGVNRQSSTYDVVFEGPVRGLEVGGEVRFNGIKVGEVTDLSLSRDNPKDVIARIQVQSNTPISVTSVAELEPAGLTGTAYVQISAGQAGSARLEARLGQGPPRISSRRGQLDRLFGESEDVISTTLTTVTNFNRLLSEDNMRNFGASLANIERLTAELASQSSALAAFRDASLEATQLSRVARASTQRLTNQAINSAATYDALGRSLLIQTQGLTAEAQGLISSSKSLVSSSNALVAGLNEDANSLSGGAELTLARTIDTLGAAEKSMSEFNQTAKTLRKATTQFGALASTATRATNSIDRFFIMGIEQTLPELSRAAQEVRNTSITFDQLGQQIGQNPIGVLSQPQPATVEWKR
jgi:phospholipid/cholesterol/gamma-HCH transport system substrate-binding protein